MMGKIAEHPGSELRLLRTLLQSGLIEADDNRGPRFGDNARVYRLTERGWGALSTG